MKKIIFLLSIVTLLGCTKKIEIEYQSKEKRTEETEKPPTPPEETKDFLVGTWEGPMNCPSCCRSKYLYVLTITKHEKDNIEGTLKISNVPEQQYAASFNLDLSFDSSTSTLTVRTKGKIKENSNPRCSKFCDNNTYELKLSKDKKVLSGKWTKSDCSVDLPSTSINIEKL